MQLLDSFGPGGRVLLTALAAVAAGCLTWSAIGLMPPVPKPGVGAKPVPAAPQRSASARLGDLQVSPLQFGMAPGAVASLVPQSAVIAPSGLQDVTVLGVARFAGRGRALVARGQSPGRWIGVGECVEGLCVTSVGRASATLTAGGQTVNVEIFHQKAARPENLPPVTLSGPATAAPIAAPPPPIAPAPPLAGAIEPTLPPGVTAPGPPSR